MSDDNHSTINKMVQGFKLSRVLGSIAEIGVADHLPPNEARSVTALAQACAVDADRLLRALRLLCAFGVFVVDPATNEFRHTPLSLHLRSDHPQTVRFVARGLTASGNWRAFEALTEGLRGKTPHIEVWGMTRFEHLAAHPQESQWFDEYMATASDNRHANIAARYDFPTKAAVVDVGGGNGELLRQIIQRHPSVTGLLYDQAHVVGALTREQLLDGQITAIGGSFFDKVPEGGNIYLLTKILHDWSDAKAIAILKNIRQSMKHTSRLLINELLVDPDPRKGYFMIYHTDINMMAAFEGACERTEQEFATLLGHCGLRLTRVLDAKTISVIEAEPC